MSENPPQAIIDRDRELAELRRSQPKHDGPWPIGAIPNESARRAFDVAVLAVMTQHKIDRVAAVQLLETASREDADERETRVERERLEREERRLVHLEKLLIETGVAVRAELMPAVVRGQLEETQAIREVRAWISGPRRFLALIGDGGTGKTVAISTAVAHWLRKRAVVVHVAEAALVSLAKSNTNDARDRLHAIGETELLVIEEAGKGLASDAELAGAVVSDLVNDRIRLPGSYTAIVGNIKLAQAVQRYGTRWGDRMREVGVVREMKLAPGEQSMRAR